MRRPRTRRWQYARPRRGSRARGHGPVSVVRQDGLHGPGVAPSVVSLARVLAGQGRGPRRAQQGGPERPGGGSSTPLSNACWQPAPPRIVLERGRKCVVLQPSSAITPAWRWPGWSPGPPPVTRPSGSRGKGVRAYGVPQRLPGRQRGLVEPHPQGPAGPAGGSRQSAGRGAHHRQALQAHHPRRRNERFHPRPAAPARASSPWPPPSPSPRAQARHLRPHPHDTERPHQSLPGRTTPAQARDATEVAQAPRPPHDDPPAQPARPPRAPRPRGRDADPPPPPPGAPP